MTDTTTTQAGLFAAVAEKPRTVRGLLLPYGEESRLSQSGTAPITFPEGTVRLPRDPSVVTVNLEHDRFQPLGRATSLESVPGVGIVAEFAIADTDEGDAYLADPSRRRLSAELRDIVRAGAVAVGAALTGAALVTEGAFASAGLFALGDVQEGDEEPEAEVESTTGDGDHVQLTADTKPEDVTVTTPDGQTTTYVPADAEDEQTTEAAPAAGEEATMGNAVAPTTATEADVQKAEELGANAVFAAMTAVMHGHGSEKAQAEQMLAALSDIKHTGSGALPATGVLQPAWIGEAWKGRAYQRKYITLGTQGTIAAMDAKGFVLDQGTALVQEWAGNKTQLPTGTASTSLVASVLTKYGFAADIAREFFDLPGGEEVIAAFWRGVLESYARITDRKALSFIVQAAGAPVAAATYPTDYPAALGMLMQGILAIEDAEDTPTFAIMNTAAYQQALFTGHEKIPEFVNFDFGTKGEGTADGFRVVRGDIGIENTPAVLVGSKQGIRFNEIGETPIQVDALDVARGGVDRAAVGYLQTLIERPASFVLIGTADS
ncbi:hypothetical protein [Agrococcus jejuensis]|uniref:hypothetical protein n=1 Tax=Agrococcus jejuensis TaxID=399736 RepID=UPI0011A797AB|nr:hypothetical protein [Agrococcus jejuensis]